MGGRNLNAIEAFVSWEETVGAAEVNRLHSIPISATNNTLSAGDDDWSLTTHPLKETDISMEKAKMDKSTIKQALDL